MTRSSRAGSPGLRDNWSIRVSEDGRRNDIPYQKHNVYINIKQKKNDIVKLLDPTSFQMYRFLLSGK